MARKYSTVQDCFLCKYILFETAVITYIVYDILLFSNFLCRFVVMFQDVHNSIKTLLYCFQDAHNCIPDFDKETSTAMFAVYDGHGGKICFCSVRCLFVGLVA